MLDAETLDRYAGRFQTSPDNIKREYCQHLFLSYLYQETGSDRLLFKGGTALRIVFGSPRFSEDLDFSGYGLKSAGIETLVNGALVNLEKTGLSIDIEESKRTSGGYLGIIWLLVGGTKIKIQLEVSLRPGLAVKGERSVIQNEFIPAYTLVHLPENLLVQEKIAALLDRKKPRDFYDYYYLLCGNYAAAKEKFNLERVLNLLLTTKIDFRRELRQFLPAGQVMQLKSFKEKLINKIKKYIR